MAVVEICRRGGFSDAPFYKRHACRLVGPSRDSYRQAPATSAQTAAAWRFDYNEVRPLGSIGRVPPARFAERHRRRCRSTGQTNQQRDPVTVNQHSCRSIGTAEGAGHAYAPMILLSDTTSRRRSAVWTHQLSNTSHDRRTRMLRVIQVSVIKRSAASITLCSKSARRCRSGDPAGSPA